MYDIVISFAGEDRETAKALADALTLKGLTVFYDEYAKADLWGKDLYSHLTHVYRDEAKYCVMIISEAYAQKQWTNHERRAAQARAIRENREYILPLRLDDASVEGVLQTTSYMDYRATPLEEVVDLLVEKVTSYNRERGIAFEVVRLEEVFLKAGLGPKGKLPIRDADFTTACPTCSTQQAASEASISLDGSDTVYTCKNDCQPIIVVSRPGLVAWPGRGYRLDNYVVRNASDMFFKTADMQAAVLMPASKSALMKRRPGVQEQAT
jgi:hypothetical protein